MAEVKSYKCLNCRAPLHFNPEKQQWSCGYCFSSFTKEELDASPLNGDQPPEEAEELDVYHCENCGAELIADHATAATFCLYCKSPSVIKARFSGAFKPSRVIPFKVTKKEAEDKYRHWIKKCLFAPRAFKEDEEIEKVTGMYAPFWMYKAAIRASLQGEATTVSSWRVGNYRYTKTKFYDVAREAAFAYDLLPVDGSVKLDDALMEQVEPYDYSGMQPFSMQYMAGFLAERYDVDEEAARKRAKARLDGYAGNRMRETVTGYAAFTPRSSESVYDTLEEDYVLMPIYILNNPFQGKDHIFLVNGQTGKVVGQTPVSRKKQLLFGAAVFLGIYLLGALGGAAIG